MLSGLVSMGSSASASEGPAGYKKAISWPTTRMRCGGVAAQFIESRAVPIYDTVVVQKHINHLANVLSLCQKKLFQLTQISSITFIEGL